MNVGLPRSPQRPLRAQCAPTTLRVFFAPGHAGCAAPALAAVLTPPHTGDAGKQEDLTSAMQEVYGPSFTYADRAVRLGDTFEGKVVGPDRASKRITVSAAVPTEHYMARITVMAGSILPANPCFATLWLYAAWGDLWTSPDALLERAFMSYLGRQFARQHAPDPRAKRRKLDGIAE